MRVNHRPLALWEREGVRVLPLRSKGISMRVVLWDTRESDVSKGFAGGPGMAQFNGGVGLRGRIMRHFFARAGRPVALVYAYLAAIFRRLGHAVQYVEDRMVDGADLYVFCPELITLYWERRAMVQVLARNPGARVLVVGALTSLLPEAFEGLGVTLVKGEAEQLLWKLDDVLARPDAVVQLGLIEDLDRLPLADWSPFGPRRFRIRCEFSKFPTALVEQSRGCVFKCSYCPCAVPDSGVRYRSPEAVVDEICHGVNRWGFRSFKFRDPLFGTDRGQVFRLAQLLGRLGRKIQFSIETRIELMRPEILRVLRQAGLTSISVGIETPDVRTLERYGRTPVAEQMQRELIARCRELGIRTAAAFMIGFPHDTEESVRDVLRYAQSLNPTFAHFNILTPYPGTALFDRTRERIADSDFSRRAVCTPAMKYEHLTAPELEQLHAGCLRQFYFRWDYLRENAPLLWPRLGWLGLGRPKRVAGGAEPAHAGPPRPLSGLEILRRTRGLRQDGPHCRPGASDDRSERLRGE